MMTATRWALFSKIIRRLRRQRVALTERVACERALCSVSLSSGRRPREPYHGFGFHRLEVPEVRTPPAVANENRGYFACLKGFGFHWPRRVGYEPRGPRAGGSQTHGMVHEAACRRIGNPSTVPKVGGETRLSSLM